MHLPYIACALSRRPPDAPPVLLVPLLIGTTTRASEDSLAVALAPLLADVATLVVASTDFCHYGRFVAVLR